MNNQSTTSIFLPISNGNVITRVRACTHTTYHVQYLNACRYLWTTEVQCLSSSAAHPTKSQGVWNSVPGLDCKCWELLNGSSRTRPQASTRLTWGKCRDNGRGSGSGKHSRPKSNIRESCLPCKVVKVFESCVQSLNPNLESLVTVCFVKLLNTSAFQNYTTIYTHTRAHTPLVHVDSLH